MENDGTREKKMKKKGKNKQKILHWKWFSFQQL